MSFKMDSFTTFEGCSGLTGRKASRKTVKERAQPIIQNLNGFLDSIPGNKGFSALGRVDIRQKHAVLVKCPHALITMQPSSFHLDHWLR